MNETNVNKYLDKHLTVRENNGSSELLSILITDISDNGELIKVTGDMKDLLVIKDFEEDFTIVDINVPENDGE